MVLEECVEHIKERHSYPQLHQSFTDFIKKISEYSRTNRIQSEHEKLSS